MTDNDKALAARIRKEVCNCHICGLCGWKPKRAADRIEALIAENERLREAGNELGGYAGHDDSCDCVKGWAKGPCNCGYTETWNQWSAALGDAE